MAEHPTTVLRSATEESWAGRECKQRGLTARVWKTEQTGKAKHPAYTSLAKALGNGTTQYLNMTAKKERTGSTHDGF